MTSLHSGTRTIRIGHLLNCCSRIKHALPLERRDHNHIRNYRWYTDFHLVNLLSVATGKPNFPSKVQGKTTDENFATDIYFRTAGYEENRKAIRQDKMLFTLADIKEDLATCLSTGIEKCEWLWQPTDLYIQALYDNSLRPQTKFCCSRKRLRRTTATRHTTTNICLRKNTSR